MIIDTSVAVAWYLELPWSASARQLVSGNPPLEAPDLLVAEVTNAFWKSFRAGIVTEERATASMDHLANAVTLIPLTALRRDALALSLALDHPAYDCFFLAAARAGGAPFVTADRKLATLAKRAAVKVELLTR